MEKQTLQERYSNGSVANKLEYKEVIGSLQYTATISTPDISYAAGKLAGYAKNVLIFHCVQVKRVLRYLHRTTLMRLCLYNSDGQIVVVTYANIDYTGDDDRKSTSGFLIKYRDSIVHLRLKKQMIT